MTNKILHGDCLDRLKELPDNSVDSVVTDPPYGLSKEPDITEVLTKWMAGEPYDHGHKGFMGKEWDSFVPHPDIWKEVYRVLKPGGHALVFAGTRTQDLMTTSLRLAGFEVRDVIEWIYFSGFPKSLDVSKAFDKRNGRNYPDDDFRGYLKERAKTAGFTGAAVDRALGTNGMWSHYVGRSQPAFPKPEVWAKLKLLLNLDDRYDEIIYRGEAKRDKVGEGSSGKTYAMGGIRNSQTGEGVFNITAPKTKLAKQWDGWGTELKPAHEPIIMVRKPLTGAVVDNVEKHDTGALNIGDCRIGNEKTTTNGRGSMSGSTPIEERSVNQEGATRVGRFPPNCITLEFDQFYSKHFNVMPSELSKKASKKDRNSDWRGEEIRLEERRTGHGNLHNSGGFERFNTVNKNNHPTVKPTDLMAWLVRLITPPEGIVLDPFAGSGSTLVAAKREGFGFIGVEREERYVEICEARTGENSTKELQSV